MNDDRWPAAARPTVGAENDARCADAIEQERRRLSRLLHDTLAQDLVSIGYLLDDLIADDPDVNTGCFIETVAMARNQVSTTRAELRRLIDDLRGSATTRTDTAHPVRRAGTSAGSDTGAETGALERSLGSFAHGMARRYGFTVHIDAHESTTPLADEVTAELDRIGREAITNVARHAAARTLWLTIRVDAPAAALVVTDDGIGIAAAQLREHEPVPGHGTAIIAERAEHIGGSAHISTRPGGGTVVTVSTGEEVHDNGARLRDPGR